MHKYLLYILILTGLLNSSNLMGQSLVSVDTLINNDGSIINRLETPTDSVSLVVGNILKSELSDLDKEEVIIQYLTNQRMDTASVGSLFEDQEIDNNALNVMKKVKMRFHSQKHEDREGVISDIELNRIPGELGKDLSSSTVSKMDSTSINEASAEVKEDIKDDLIASVNGITLTKLDKDDLSNRLNSVLENYDWEDLWAKYGIDEVSTQEQIKGRVDKYANTVLDGYLLSQLGSVKIFNDMPEELFREKKKLQGQVLELNAVEQEKKKFFENWNFDRKSRNSYYDFLFKEKDYSQFSEEIESYKSSTTLKQKKKEYRKLNGRVGALNRKEEKIKKEIHNNKYFKHLRENYGDEFQAMGELKSEDFNDGTLTKTINERANYELVRALLDRDYISSKMQEVNSQFTKVNSEVISEEVLKALDSAEAGNKIKKNLGKIKEVSENKDLEEVKEIVLTESDKKGLMPKNTYFEGVVGILRKDFTVLNISPNVGYDLTDNLSVGFGISFQHTGDKEAFIVTAIDYKLFAKYELLNDRFFLQSEYISLIPGLSYIKVREGSYGFDDTLLFGGGINIRYKGKNAISFSLLYNMNDKIGTPAYESAFLTRLGIKIF